MGDRSGRPNEAPAHEVKIAAFTMDIHEATQADFARYDLPNPSHFKGP
jgi:formylglycine-generating enzyme required for sulfatase activity